MWPWSKLFFNAIKGTSSQTEDAFFNARSHHTTIKPAEIFFLVIYDIIDPVTDQKGHAMAKPNYQFKKRQKELAKKKKKEEKRQRKLKNKGIQTDETEKDPTPTPSTENQ